jgi:beta-phosphoglucomutase-like phosphatase (HAD superfamily)
VFASSLELEQPKYPGDFSPLPGAIEFLLRLRSELRCDVAIATGCFELSARFKLRCCGINLDTVPHATSSDTPSRGEIIALAASRAGYALSNALYFADGPWDVQASKRLGIPMIGIGRRYQELTALGLEHVFRDYTEPERILAAVREIGAKLPNPA